MNEKEFSMGIIPPTPEFSSRGYMFLYSGLYLLGDWSKEEEDALRIEYAKYKKEYEIAAIKRANTWLGSQKRQYKKKRLIKNLFKRINNILKG